MMLAKRGLFHLMRPVSDFIPAFANIALPDRCAYGPLTKPNCQNADAAPAADPIPTGLSYPVSPRITAKAMDRSRYPVPRRSGLAGADDRPSGRPAR